MVPSFPFLFWLFQLNCLRKQQWYYLLWTGKPCIQVSEGTKLTCQVRWRSLTRGKGLYASFKKFVWIWCRGRRAVRRSLRVPYSQPQWKLLSPQMVEAFRSVCAIDLSGTCLRMSYSSPKYKERVGQSCYIAANVSFPRTYQQLFDWLGRKDRVTSQSRSMASSFAALQFTLLLLFQGGSATSMQTVLAVLESLLLARSLKSYMYMKSLPHCSLSTWFESVLLGPLVPQIPLQSCIPILVWYVRLCDLICI